jgi:peroxiredoxin
MKRQLLLLSILLVTIYAFAGGYKVGDKATDFRLLNVDGKMVSMKDFTNAKGIVVIFTCNHCPYSKLYENRIIALDKKYKTKGYPVVAINPNDSTVVPEDSYSNMKVRAAEKGFTFPYLFDAGQRVTKEYGALRTPHVFLLQKENDEYVVKYIGAIDDNSQSPEEVEQHFVEDAIDALLTGKDPDPNFTKAIGCTVKWAE